MDLLRLLCHGRAQLLAKVRLAICLLCAAVPSPGAAYRCCHVLVNIRESGSLSGVSEKGQCVRILCPYHLADHNSHLF